MARWEDFDSTFCFKGDHPYQPKLVDRIFANRRALHNILFIDRLLKALGINSASRLYPPKCAETLRKLHEEILNSSSPNHHKQSVIYYILRDCQDASDGPSSLHFAQKCFLPRKYQLLVDGLWYLDRREFRRALEYLTEPSLVPTFPDEILHVLSTVATEDDSLAVAYYITVSPPLASNKVLEAYFSVLCRNAVPTAFYFARKQRDDTRRKLLDQLIVSVLSIQAGEARAEKAMALVALPFTETETQWFEECLLSGKAKSLPGAKDTAMMRRISMGRSDKLGKLKSLGSRKIESLDWDVLRKNLRSSVS